MASSCSHLRLGDKSTGCEHKGWVAGGCREEKRRYTNQPTTALDTTSSWDFEGWESCSYLCRGYQYQLLLWHAQAKGFPSMREQGNLAIWPPWQHGARQVARLRGGCAGLWLILIVPTKSSKWQPRLSLSAQPRPLTQHLQRRSISREIPPRDQHLNKFAPDLPALPYQWPQRGPKRRAIAV